MADQCQRATSEELTCPASDSNAEKKQCRREEDNSTVSSLEQRVASHCSTDRDGEDIRAKPSAGEEGNRLGSQTARNRSTPDVELASSAAPSWSPSEALAATLSQVNILGNDAGQPGPRETRTETQEEDKGEDEFPQTVDDEWFEGQLNALPTMFRVPAVFRLNRQQLLSRYLMARVVMEKFKKEPEKDEREVALTSHSLSQILALEGDDPAALLQIQNEARQQKMKEKPENVWKRATFTDRTCAWRSFILFLDWLLGRKKKAEEEARRLAHAFPYSFVAMSNLFYILWKTGDREGALRELRSMLKIKKENLYACKVIQDEETGELGRNMTELGPDLTPEAVAWLTRVVAAQPTWHHYKYFLALNYRRLSKRREHGNTAGLDPDAALINAFELHLELQQLDVRQDPSMGPLKTSSASELCEILDQCEKYGRSAGERECLHRAQKVGLTAAKCSDMVMGSEHVTSYNLVRVGKFYRNKRDYQKSYEVLKKAAEEQRSSKAHHQLALTLSKMARDGASRTMNDSRKTASPSPAADDQWTSVSWRRGADSLQTAPPGVEGHRRPPPPPPARRLRLPRPDRRMGDLERKFKLWSWSAAGLSRKDERVQEMMYHLHEALRLSEGNNDEALVDLGLTYRDLGEHQDALEQFVRILDLDGSVQNVCRAFEQCGSVFLEQFKSDNSIDARSSQRFLDKASAAFTMAILVQARHVWQQRTPSAGVSLPSVWENLYTLGQYLRLPEQRAGQHRRQEQPRALLERFGVDDAELWLLRLLWLYADATPTLTSLQKVTHREALNPLALRSELLWAERQQRYEDVILLAYVYRLLTGKDRTGCEALEAGQRSRESCSEDRVLAQVMKAHVLAAKARLLEDVREGWALGSCTINRCSAQRFFRWVFQDSFPEPQPRNFALEDSSLDPYTECSANLSPPQTVDRVDDDLEVLNVRETAAACDVAVLHEQDDQRAVRAARIMSNVLQQVCGLKTRWAGGDKQSLHDMTHDILKAVDTARVVVFIISSNEMTSELEACVKRASWKLSTNEWRRVVTFSLAPTLTLPAVLRPGRSYQWLPALDDKPEGVEASRQWLHAACSTFSSVADID